MATVPYDGRRVNVLGLACEVKRGRLKLTDIHERVRAKVKKVIDEGRVDNVGPARAAGPGRFQFQRQSAAATRARSS